MLLVIPHANYANVVDVLATQQLSLQLGGGYLEALCSLLGADNRFCKYAHVCREEALTVLDELLDAVGNV